MMIAIVGQMIHRLRQPGDTLGELVDQHCPGISDAKRDQRIGQIAALNNLVSRDRIETGATWPFPP